MGFHLAIDSWHFLLQGFQESLTQWEGKCFNISQVCVSVCVCVCVCVCVFGGSAVEFLEFLVNDSMTTISRSRCTLVEETLWITSAKLIQLVSDSNR